MTSRLGYYPRAAIVTVIFVLLLACERVSKLKNTIAYVYGGYVHGINKHVHLYIYNEIIINLNGE